MMKPDWSKWEAWERGYLASTPVDAERKIRWADAALEHAWRMSVFPPKDPLLEEKIEWVKRLHALRDSSRKSRERQILPASHTDSFARRLCMVQVCLPDRKGCVQIAARALQSRNSGYERIPVSTGLFRQQQQWLAAG